MQGMQRQRRRWHAGQRSRGEGGGEGEGYGGEGGVGGRGNGLQEVGEAAASIPGLPVCPVGHQLLPLPISARQFFPKRRCWYARINLYTYSIQCSFSLVVTIP